MKTKKDSHFIPAPFITTTEYENHFIKVFNDNLAVAVGEVLKYIAKTTASTLKNATLDKSVSDNDIEKAHQDGDMHPSKPWVWVASANQGKGDWRMAKNKPKKANIWDMHPDVDKCKTTKDCVNLLINNNIIHKSSDLGNCDINSAKKVCSVAYRMHDEYGLTPISLGFRKLGQAVMQATDGRRIDLNSDYFSNFDEAKSYRQTHTKYTQRLRLAVDSINSTITNLTTINPNFDTSTLLDKKKDIEDKINNCPCWTTGNVDSVTQDIMIHEFGHILNSQCTGGCSHRFVAPRTKQYLDLATSLNAERNKTFGDYLKGGVYISEYSTTKPAEFFAESFVAYTHNDKNLLPDVRKFIDKYFQSTKPIL